MGYLCAEMCFVGFPPETGPWSQRFGTAEIKDEHVHGYEKEPLHLV